MQGNSFTKINFIETSKLFPFYFRRSVLVGALFLLFVLWIFAIFAKSFRVNIHFERKENPALLKSIDQQCLKLERQNLEKPELFSNFQTDMENANLELKQHLITKTLKFFPTLNQMWCFVPQTGEEETWTALVLDYNRLQSIPASSPVVSNVGASRTVSPGQDYVRAIMSDSVSKILLTRHPFARIADYFRKNIIATNKTQAVSNILVKKNKTFTFPEFVDYLLSTSERNYPDDLRPIFQLCGLCHIKYEIVLRYEDMNFTGIVFLKSLEMEPVVIREEAPRKAKTFHSQAPFGNQLFRMYQEIPRQKISRLITNPNFPEELLTHILEQIYCKETARTLKPLAVQPLKMTDPQSGEKLQKLELADKAEKFTMNGLKIKLVLSLIFLSAAFVTWAIITLRTPHQAKPHKFREPVIVETFEPAPDINPDVTEILRIPSILADSEEYVVHGVNCSIPYVPIQGKVLRKLWNQHSMEIPVCRTDPSGILSTFYTDSEELEIYNLDNFKSCCYREIRRPVTPQGDTYELSEVCTPYKGRTKLHGVEYFFIQCKTKPSSQYRGGVRYRFHANIPKKDDVLLKEHFWKDGFQSGSEVPVSVSILILDSVSRIHAYRTLPKTMTYLLENMNFVDFRGHHILGEPTMPNVIPLLMGEPSAEHFWNHTKPDWTSQWDPYPFIWKAFSSLNYVTFFSEDNARISTFNYGDQRGFLEPPTDYYTRPLFAALEDGMFSSMPSHGACFGNETASQFSLNHHLHFLKKMQPTPTFSLNRLTVPQHDVMEASATLDAPLLNYFKKLSSSKSIMQSTVFILMSDHGFWSNPYARTYEGLLERRLPFLLVRLPEKLLQKHPEYLSALEKNANSVTSHHDVHETLLHLVTLTSGKKGKPRKKTSPQTSPYRHSLLKPLPSPRSCKDANIPRHICTCKLPIPDDNPEFIHAFLPNRLRLPSPMKGAMPFYS